MLGSLKLGRISGIDIRMHWTFLPLAFLFVGLNPSEGLVILLALFGSVLLHELGHSLVAQRFGVHVVDITFWPLGGMARMSEIPEEPRVEGWIAIAGPAVNFVLVALTLPLALLLSFTQLGLLAGFAGKFLLINLILGTFNLAPAFPMDGGRILRAWLARKRNYVRATELAVRAGRVVAVFMIVLSLFLGFVTQTVCILPVIAIFIWFAGGRELMAVRMRHGLSPIGGVPFEGLRTAPPGAEAQRPGAWDQSRGPSRGFTEQEIRELERFRGRLRRPPRTEG